MKNNVIIASVLVCGTLLFCGCASKKNLLKEEGALSGKQTEAKSNENHQLAYVRKVAENAVPVKNIHSKISFNFQMGDKDITVPGQIHMRKDDVIRIQLQVPLLGSEVGRLEFTKDYVLVVDRIHKEYVKGDYNQLDFLRENGLNFSSLQALFWNELFQPGSETLTDDMLQKFNVHDGMAAQTTISFVQGAMNYEWDTEQSSGRIVKTKVSYQSSHHGDSYLTVDYGDFRNVGVKQFPASQVTKFVTKVVQKKKEGQMTINMNNIDTSANWDTRTVVSDRYKRVEAKDVLGKLMSF